MFKMSHLKHIQLRFDHATIGFWMTGMPEYCKGGVRQTRHVPITTACGTRQVTSKTMLVFISGRDTFIQYILHSSCK